MKAACKAVAYYTLYIINCTLKNYVYISDRKFV